MKIIKRRTDGVKQGYHVKIMKDFEHMKDMAEAKAYSNLSLKRPLTDKEYKRYMELGNKLGFMKAHKPTIPTPLPTSREHFLSKNPVSKTAGICPICHTLRINDEEIEKCIKSHRRQ